MHFEHLLIFTRTIGQRRNAQLSASVCIGNFYPVENQHRYLIVTKWWLRQIFANSMRNQNSFTIGKHNFKSHFRNVYRILTALKWNSVLPNHLLIILWISNLLDSTGWQMTCFFLTVKASNDMISLNSSLKHNNFYYYWVSLIYYVKNLIANGCP